MLHNDDGLVLVSWVLLFSGTDLFRWGGGYALPAGGCQSFPRDTLIPMSGLRI